MPSYLALLSIVVKRPTHMNEQFYHAVMDVMEVAVLVQWW